MLVSRNACILRKRLMLLWVFLEWPLMLWKILRHHIKIVVQWAILLINAFFGNWHYFRSLTGCRVNRSGQNSVEYMSKNRRISLRNLSGTPSNPIAFDLNCWIALNTFRSNVLLKANPFKPFPSVSWCTVLRWCEKWIKLVGGKY
jgi:hypothetical protein